MSLPDIILFPFIPQELYTEYKIAKKVTVKGLTTLSKKLNELFCDSANGNKLSQLILFDFYLSINHHTVYKDNITGKRIEQKTFKAFCIKYR
jgi:hypothetical protein